MAIWLFVFNLLKVKDINELLMKVARFSMKCLSLVIIPITILWFFVSSFLPTQIPSETFEDVIERLLTDL